MKKPQFLSPVSSSLFPVSCLLSTVSCLLLLPSYRHNARNETCSTIFSNSPVDTCAFGRKSFPEA